jgi:dihydroorotate dehydrogenase
MYRQLLKPLLFKLDPERAHHLTFRLLSILNGIPFLLTLLRYKNRNRPTEAVEIAGLRFPNRVGLAAGLDKDALHYRELGALGFGFIEVGTVTPEPQPGNPKPRLFRLPKDNALINRMGFNNRGVDSMYHRLQGKRHGLVIGGNIGKNKSTPNEHAADDYTRCFRRLFPVVDYFVVNVSSPNTPGLRELQEKGPLKELLNGLQELNKELSVENKVLTKPVFLKIAPDLTDAQLDDVIEVIQDTKCAGVIATNTTISRSGLTAPAEKLASIGAGGLSGKPLTSRSTEVIRYLADHSQGKFAIIGVGGIHTPEDALEKLQAGASLIQLYTGFVYEGPRLIRSIRKAISENRPLTTNH